MAVDEIADSTTDRTMKAYPEEVANKDGDFI